MIIDSFRRFCCTAFLVFPYSLLQCTQGSRAHAQLTNAPCPIASVASVSNDCGFYWMKAETELRSGVYHVFENGRVLASASDDKSHKTVRLWNLDKCRPIGSPLRPQCSAMIQIQ